LKKVDFRVALSGMFVAFLWDGSADSHAVPIHSRLRPATASAERLALLNRGVLVQK